MLIFLTHALPQGRRSRRPSGIVSFKHTSPLYSWTHGVTAPDSPGGQQPPPMQSASTSDILKGTRPDLCSKGSALPSPVAAQNQRHPPTPRGGLLLLPGGGSLTWVHSRVWPWAHPEGSHRVHLRVLHLAHTALSPHMAQYGYCMAAPSHWHTCSLGKQPGHCGIGVFLFCALLFLFIPPFSPI